MKNVTADATADDVSGEDTVSYNQHNEHETKILINDARHAYEKRGDVSSALNILHSISYDNSKQRHQEDDLVKSWDETIAFDIHHNLALLTYLLFPIKTDNINGNENDDNNIDAFEKLLKELYAEDIRSKTEEENENMNRNDVELIIPSMKSLIVGHNLALKYLITNRAEEGVSILLPLFRSFSSSSSSVTSLGKDDASLKTENDDEDIAFDNLKCKVTFLLLDCILDSLQVKTINEILQWLQSFIADIVKNIRDESLSASLMFRLHCYKSRALFVQSKYDEISIREKNIRVVKKELKSAMEIYHHKIEKNEVSSHTRIKDSAGGESTIADEVASVQESVSPSLGSMSNDHLQDISTATSGLALVGTENHSHFHMKRLRRQNQCALYLKANLEYLKGNTKKSLILCSEAQHCGLRYRDSSSKTTNEAIERQRQWTSDVQSAFYFNNLAIIHQKAGKLHLAMHYYSRSLGYVENMEQEGNRIMVENDGIASPIPLSQILFNAAICAQQVANFSGAHECMKRCVAASPSLFGMDPLCWLHMGESCINSHLILKRKYRKSVLNSSSDSTNSSEIMSANSLSLNRAIDCLNKCIILSTTNGVNNHDYLEAARVLLAYIWLEKNNPSQVIQLADLVLKEETLSSIDDKNLSMISQRRRASIRMYACEALTMMGMANEGLKYINDQVFMKENGNDQYLSQIASHLAAINASKIKNLNQEEIKRITHAKASIQIASANTKLSTGDFEHSLEDSQSACTNMIDEIGMSSLKRTARSCLIQSLICCGKITEAIKEAETLK